MQVESSAAIRAYSGAAALVFIFAAGSARADVFDVAWFLSRVGGWDTSPERAVAAMIGLMAVNYVLNVLVIGVGAGGKSPTTRGRRLGSLVWFTLAGQVIDRVGAVVGIPLGLLVVHVLGVRGDAELGLGVMTGVGINFVLAGAGIAGLAYWLLGRWRVPRARRTAVAIAAGILTNPAWAMALWL